MNRHLFAVSLLFAFSLSCVKGQTVEPFVRGGLTVGFFDNGVSNVEDVGHTGFNMGAGVMIPVNKLRHLSLEPSVVFVSKGDVYDVRKAGGRVSFNLRYLEAQCDFVYRWKVGKHCYVPIGTGLYGAYGIGGKVSATNGITWFKGIPVGESPSAFDSSIGTTRWDVGWRVCTLGVDYCHFLFRFDMEMGFVSQFRNRLSNRGGDNNASLSFIVGYLF